MGNRGALGADVAPPRARQAASSSASSPCASHASGDAHGTIALLTLLRRVAIGAGVLGVLGVLWALKAHAGTLLTLLATQVHSAGAWGVAGYVAAFAAWGVLCLPLSPFELLSGFLFPFWTALAACVLGKVGGAALCFLAGRTVGAGIARRALARHETLRALGDAVASRPFSTTLLLRFAYLPAALKNYGWSLTPVRLPVFLLACALEAPVYSVPLVLVGARAEGLAQLLSGRAPLGPEAAASMALGIAMLLLWLAVMRRLSQAALRQAGGGRNRTQQL